MLNVSFIGTCQIEALIVILKNTTFFEKYKMDKMIIVHNTSETSINYFFDHDIKNMDLIICQPISQSYSNGLFSTSRLLKNISSNCQIIMIPFIYFDGYFNSICYLKNSKGNKIEKEGFVYHDMNIIKHIMAKVDLSKSEGSKYLIETHNLEYHTDRIINIMKNINYNSYDFYNRAIENSIKKLEIREKNPYDYGKTVDIKISDFIRDNYKTTRLFNTMNHPTNYLMIEVVKRVLLYLNLSRNTEIVCEKELLGQHIFPIYPSFIEKIGIQDDTKCKINDIEYSYEEFISKYISFYFNSIKIETLIDIFLNN